MFKNMKDFPSMKWHICSTNLALVFTHFIHFSPSTYPNPSTCKDNPDLAVLNGQQECASPILKSMLCQERTEMRV